jgi:hypothetical protein
MNQTTMNRTEWVDLGAGRVEHREGPWRAQVLETVPANGYVEFRMTVSEARGYEGVEVHYDRTLTFPEGKATKMREKARDMAYEVMLFTRESVTHACRRPSVARSLLGF